MEASGVAEPAFEELAEPIGPLPPLVPPAEEAEPVCADTQAAHAKKTSKQGVERFSHCIGTPPKAAAALAGYLFTKHPTPDFSRMEDARERIIL
jgi:hypothetical protein